ncbi:MAG: lipopolysaccharide heptosyltransferase II [Ottowia sp.]|nr:lipopolysaccharide heptosyltransferase II [Ottowia sp.]
MLMAQPLLAALKTDASIHLTVMAAQWVAPVLQYMSEVDAVIPTQLMHGALQVRARWQFARLLRGKFDVCYVLPNSLKSALIPWLAGIPLRVGYLGEMRWGLLNRWLPNPVKAVRAPMVTHYAALAYIGRRNLGGAAQLSTSTHTAALMQPTLSVSAAEKIESAQRFAIEGHRPILALCPGAEFGPAKRWPIAYFLALAQQVHAHRADVEIIALGSAKDRAIAAELGPLVRNLCGDTSLSEAIALLARADAAVCNDSGLMHVRAALNRPQVAIFGSSDPRHTPPLSTQAITIWQQLACSPCYARVCPLGHLRCLYDITPARVLPLVLAMLPIATE